MAIRAPSRLMLISRDSIRRRPIGIASRMHDRFPIAPQRGDALPFGCFGAPVVLWACECNVSEKVDLSSRSIERVFGTRDVFPIASPDSWPRNRVEDDLAVGMVDDLAPCSGGHLRSWERLGGLLIDVVAAWTVGVGECGERLDGVD